MRTPPKRKNPRRAPKREPQRRLPPPHDARDLVMRTLAEQVRRFPDLDLAPLDDSALDPREAAFAHAIYDAAIARWLSLWFLIEGCLDRPAHRVEPRASAALLAGAAQIFFLDRVPVHAAVNESVGWTRRIAGLASSRLVNAVLRRLCRLLPQEQRQYRDAASDQPDELPMPDGRALILAEPVLPEDALRRCAVATSHPIDLIRAWSKRWSTLEARRLALHSLVAPPVILNTLHAAQPLPENLVPHPDAGHHVFTGSHADLVALLERRRDLWVQDPGSSQAVCAAADLRPTLVVDTCAGMGTKTRQLAATFPEARIIATDTDAKRLEILRRSVDPQRVQVVTPDRLIDFVGAADLVLLDVPCSNTGVLPRRPEARYRYDRARLDQLTAIQRQIIADSLRLIRGDRRQGRILYSTCSLDESENQEQPRWASRWHSLRTARSAESLPRARPGDPPTAYSDGGYWALLE